VLKGDAFARIRDRARLERQLLLHEPDRSTPAMSVRNMSLLRQMAAEGAVTNHVPAIRRGAVLLLGERPTPENLANLTELAVSGEDFYTRSYALVALGRTGLTIAAPVLRDALRAEHREERLAAETGLRLLGTRVGPAIIIALRESERDRAVREALGFHRFGVSMKAREETKRDRRIHRDEEQALLAACLKRRATLGPYAFVFGSPTGEFQDSFKTAWESLLLLANGHDTTRAKPGARVDRAELRRVDLHSHDMRHEGACRLLADGVTGLRHVHLLRCPG
jgi:hypothetical protein